MKLPIKQFTSWQYAVPGFESVLPSLRNNHLLNDSQHEKIYENHGKEVWHCRVNGYDFAYKTQPIPLKKATRFIFKPSLSAREFTNYQMVKQLNIPVPEVYAVGDTRIAGILRETFLVTQYLIDAQDGRAFMAGGKYATGHEELRLLFCKTHLSYLARLHKSGYYHKTFHARNLMFREHENGAPEFIWIDVARMNKFSADSREERNHDLQELFGDLKLPQNEEITLRQFYENALNS